MEISANTFLATMYSLIGRQAGNVKFLRDKREKLLPERPSLEFYKAKRVFFSLYKVIVLLATNPRS